MTRLFGTDGVRGKANTHPMTAEIALKLGMAAGYVFKNGGHRHKVIIGKDTRLSGYMVEPALTAGFIAMGMDVILVGPMPTPAIAMLARSMRADLGVMISASHNPYDDNGIKFFDERGLKLSDEIENEIEQLVAQNLESKLAKPDSLGKAVRLDDARGRYIEFVKHSFDRRKTLEGMRIVLDSANGACYHIAPTVLRELGAEVYSYADSPDGFNINNKCGSTHLDLLQTKVKEHRADIGIALDGDADRLIMVDEKANIIDGDQLLALIATSWQAQNRVKGDAIVATQMSNMGLEKYLQGLGLNLIRTQVGDRYVSLKMREDGYNIGGEQSGHIIMRDYTTTGDGLLAALQVLSAIIDSGKKASKACKLFEPYPQILLNYKYNPKQVSADDLLNSDNVKQAISNVEAELGDKGRVLIRKSGTEALIRVMVEGQDAKQIKKLAKAIVGEL